MSKEAVNEVGTLGRVWRAGEAALKAASGPALLTVGMSAMAAGVVALSSASLAAGQGLGMLMMSGLPLVAAGGAAVFGAGIAAFGAVDAAEQGWKHPEKKLAGWKELSVENLKANGVAMIGVGLGMATSIGTASMLAPQGPGGFGSAVAGVAVMAAVGVAATISAVAATNGILAAAKSSSAARGLAPISDILKVATKLRQKREAAAQAPQVAQAKAPGMG